MEVEERRDGTIVTSISGQRRRKRVRGVNYRIKWRVERGGGVGSNFSPGRNNVFVGRKKRAEASFFKKIKPINPSSSRKRERERESSFQLAAVQRFRQSPVSGEKACGWRSVVDETFHDASSKPFLQTVIKPPSAINQTSLSFNFSWKFSSENTPSCEYYLLSFSILFFFFFFFSYTSRLFLQFFSSPKVETERPLLVSVFASSIDGQPRIYSVDRDSFPFINRCCVRFCNASRYRAVAIITRRNNGGRWKARWIWFVGVQSIRLVSTNVSVSNRRKRSFQTLCNFSSLSSFFSFFSSFFFLHIYPWP